MKERTLKTIALELLNRYYQAEMDCIYSFRHDIAGAEKELDELRDRYLKEIDSFE